MFGIYLKAKGPITKPYLWRTCGTLSEADHIILPFMGSPSYTIIVKEGSTFPPNLEITDEPE